MPIEVVSADVGKAQAPVSEQESTQEENTTEAPALEENVESEQDQNEVEADENENTSDDQESQDQDEGDGSDQDGDEGDEDGNEDEDESGEDDEESEDESARNAKPKKESSIQKLKRKARESQDEAAYWKRRALEASQAQEKPNQETEKPEQVAKPQGRPNPDDYDNPQDYEDALVEWKVDEKLAKKEQERKLQAQREQVLKESQTFKEKVNQFADQTEDFDDVIENIKKVKPTPEVQAMLRRSEVPGELVYELAKDPKHFEKITQMHPIDAAREIGKIEAFILADKPDRESSPQRKPKKVTKAPKPVSTVGKHSKGGVKKTIFDPGLSQAEYERLRREQSSRA